MNLHVHNCTVGGQNDAPHTMTCKVRCFELVFSDPHTEDWACGRAQGCLAKEIQGGHINSTAHDPIENSDTHSRACKEIARVYPSFNKNRTITCKNNFVHPAQATSAAIRCRASPEKIRAHCKFTLHAAFSAQRCGCGGQVTLDLICARCI